MNNDNKKDAPSSPSVGGGVWVKDVSPIQPGRYYVEYSDGRKDMCYFTANAWCNGPYLVVRWLDESPPIAPPSSRELRDIIARCGPYLDILNDDNVHDPSVGLYKANHLVQLIEDIRELSAELPHPLPDHTNKK